MKLGKWLLSLVLVAVGVALVATLVATRASAPRTGPDGSSGTELFSSNLLSGTVTGLNSGLPEGQMVALSLYALPPAPGEQYGQGEPPPADGSWTYPPEVSQLAAPPDTAPDWPLAAALRVGNGPWGLVDPSLVGSKYLVVAHAAGQMVDPPAYEVVILSGKAPGFPGGVDFAFGP